MSDVQTTPSDTLPDGDAPARPAAGDAGTRAVTSARSDGASRAPGSTEPSAEAAGHGAPVLQRLLDRVAAEARLDPTIDVLRPFVSELAQGRAGALLGGGAATGHALHPALMLVPAGCWTSATVLDLTSGLAAVRGDSHRAAARRLTGLGLLGVVPTAVTGWSDWARLDERPLQRLGLAHALVNTTAVALQLRSWRLRRRGRHGRGAALGVAATTMVGVAGLLGGHVDEYRPHGRGPD